MSESGKDGDQQHQYHHHQHPDQQHPLPSAPPYPYSNMSGKVVGIDLGTTNSCVAVWSDHLHRVEIICNEQGNKLTPSCVACNEVDILVGECAKNQILMNPHKTVFAVKRLIGSSFSDTRVQEEIKSWPFKVVKGPDDKPLIVLEHKGVNREFSAEEISSKILESLKKAAEVFLGEEVSHAVITVPAYFSDHQRQSTKQAGVLAGFNVWQLISEPTAAAIAYRLNNNLLKMKNVCVFDLGGGTFDVSVLNITKDGHIKVIAVGGDTHLGGEDFDYAMVNHCVEEFKRTEMKDVTKSARAMGRLKIACEKAKRDLSSTTQTPIDIDYLYEGTDFSLKFTRAKFEELNMSFFKRCINHVQKCLSDGKMDKRNVDEIVIVGGSTRIPKVQQMLSDFFDGKALCKNIDGEEAVAYGAAMYAANLVADGNQHVQAFVLEEVTPLSLGIGIRTDEISMMTVIVPRNTPIPTRKQKVFRTRYDNQEVVLIGVYQGESSVTTDNVLLDAFFLSGIPPGPAGAHSIEVCFDINANGILNVSAELVSTGIKKSITVARRHLSDDDIREMYSTVST